MTGKLKHILSVAAIFIVALFPRCANIVAPQGGLVDSLPPVIKSVTPAGGQRNIRPTRIFVEFDEYVQLKDQGKEFFTSPLMKTRPKLSVRGKGIRIDIRDTLAENQTYSLNFGNSIRDNNEGNPLSDFRYVFSTGSTLDSLLVTGYTADAMKGDSLKAFVYFFDAALDTIPEYDSILFNHKPLTLGRTQGNGIFIAENLRDMQYRVYALQDNNNNQRYDPGTDKVGFLDTLVNPTLAEPTSIWLDEYRRYRTADPQIYFRLFTERPVRRQNLNANERPGRHQVVLRFAAPDPRIDTLTFDGIPDDRIIREYMTPGRDTISLWFDMPPGSLPDTIRGRISYHKPDSLGNVVPTSQALRLTWRQVASREQEKEREKEARERQRAEERGEEYIPPEKPNPFRFKVDAGAEVNPEKSIPIDFDLPLSTLDSVRVSLETVPDLGDPAPVPFRFVRDTMNIRRWVVVADWDERENYRLTVPAGVFVNVAGESNDSLAANFKIQKRSASGTIAATVTGKTPEAKYIVQLVDGRGKTLKEIKNVTGGTYYFYYIPEGEVRIRVTEDSNGNGSWDSGSLVDRRQPERTEFYAGGQTVASKANVQSDVALDMSVIFAPETIGQIRDKLQKAEEARVTKFLEEQAKKEEERRRRGNQSEQGGSLGIGSALGGAKQQIQSTIR